MILDALRPFAVPRVGLGGYARQMLDVVPEWVDVALGTAHGVAVMLELPPVTIVPFRKCLPPTDPDDPDVFGPLAAIPNGFAAPERPGEIFVRAELRGRQLERTVAHEIRHLWQFRQGTFASKIERESDARRFENEWLEKTA